MKHFVIPTIMLCFLFACAGEEEEGSSSDNDETEEIEQVDTMSMYEDFEGEAFTAWAAIDGPDEGLWITTPEEYQGAGDGSEELPAIEMLHIIPEQQYTDSWEHCEWMLGVMVYNFELYGKFTDYSGPVEVYYDGDKANLCARYTVSYGSPDGNVKVYDPEGSIYLDWDFKDGKWVKANISPYGANWTFDQGQSKLRVLDEDYGITYESGKKVVQLMGTYRSSMSDDNNLYTIMEKESFENPFLVNGEVFTGRLEAYWKNASVDGQLYYVLNFESGWLHGDIKIYNDWGELELHEQFNMGELDTTIYKMDYSEMDGVAKPIIYIYPEEEMVVDINLHFNGELTHTYPKYNGYWKVLAKPDGTLYDESGQEFYAMYWEGNAREQFTMDEGFCIPGEETAPFLEKSLAILGLNRREANEFIVYWLPKLENNPYNLIHFSTDEYEEMAKLNITPQPETLIRVMMVYKPLEAPVEIPLQDLNKISKKRKGFTVVEWGGSPYRERVLP